MGSPTLLYSVELLRPHQALRCQSLGKESPISWSHAHCARVRRLGRDEGVFIRMGVASSLSQLLPLSLLCSSLHHRVSVPLISPRAFLPCFQGPGRRQHLFLSTVAAPGSMALSGGEEVAVRTGLHRRTSPSPTIPPSRSDLSLSSETVLADSRPLMAVRACRLDRLPSSPRFRLQPPRRSHRYRSLPGNSASVQDGPCPALGEYGMSQPSRPQARSPAQQSSCKLSGGTGYASRGEAISSLRS